MAEKYTSNIISFEQRDKYCSVSISSTRLITLVKRVHKSRPDDFKMFIENDDGSIFAMFPAKWLNIEED